MATIHKFMFETSFDEEAEANLHVDDAPEVEPEEVEQAPVFSEEDVEVARQRGMEAGREEGKRAALEGIEAKLAETLERIFGELPGLFDAHEKSVSRAHADAIAVASATAAKLFPALNERHGLGEVVAVVEQALAKLTDEPRVAIRVAPDLVEPLRDKVDQLRQARDFRAEINVQGDDAIESGDCRLIWSDGSSERDAARLRAEIEEIVARHVGPLASAEAEPPREPQPPAASEASAETTPVPEIDTEAEPAGGEIS